MFSCFREIHACLDLDCLKMKQKMTKSLVCYQLLSLPKFNEDESHNCIQAMWKLNQNKLRCFRVQILIFFLILSNDLAFLLVLKIGFKLPKKSSDNFAKNETFWPWIKKCSPAIILEHLNEKNFYGPTF